MVIKLGKTIALVATLLVLLTSPGFAADDKALVFLRKEHNQKLQLARINKDGQIEREIKTFDRDRLNFLRGLTQLRNSDIMVLGDKLSGRQQLTIIDHRDGSVRSATNVSQRVDCSLGLLSNGDLLVAINQMGMLRPATINTSTGLVTVSTTLPHVPFASVGGYSSGKLYYQSGRMGLAKIVEYDLNTGPVRELPTPYIDLGYIAIQPITGIQFMDVSPMPGTQLASTLSGALFVNTTGGLLPEHHIGNYSDAQPVSSITNGVTGLDLRMFDSQLQLWVYKMTTGLNPTAKLQTINLSTARDSTVDLNIPGRTFEAFAGYVHQ